MYIKHGINQKGFFCRKKSIHKNWRCRTWKAFLWEKANTLGAQFTRSIFVLWDEQMRVLFAVAFLSAKHKFRCLDSFPLFFPPFSEVVVCLKILQLFLLFFCLRSQKHPRRYSDSPTPLPQLRSIQLLILFNFDRIWPWSLSANRKLFYAGCRPSRNVFNVFNKNGSSSTRGHISCSISLFLTRNCFSPLSKWLGAEKRKLGVAPRSSEKESRSWITNQGVS